MKLTRWASFSMQINYYAPMMVHLDQGYGRMAYALLQAFEKIFLDVSPVIDPKYITLVVGKPHNGYDVKLKNSRMWLFTMIESTRMSEDWVQHTNALYERVLVPSPCQVQYLVDSGVNVPVHYVPLGCDLYMPYLKERTVPTDRPFTFLTYSYGDNRKGAEKAVQAFLQLYEGDDSKRIVIKARENHDSLWLHALSEEKQINVVGGVISNAHWMHLLETSDCFVFPSRAEGYGLPPREAALSECPTIATRWLGLWDIDNWGWGVDVDKLTNTHYSRVVNNAKESQWAEPSLDSIKVHMQSIVDDYESAIIKAKRGREYLLAHHTWVGAVHAIKRLLETYA